MDIMELGAVGELVGGVAVVATLIYLALQVRQGANAATSSAMGSWLSDYNYVAMELVKDEGFTEIVRHGLSDFEKLSGNEQMRIHGWMTTHILNAQNLFLELKEGTTHPRLAQPTLAFNSRMLKTPGGRLWWDSGRSIWAPEFILHIDGLMEKTTPLDEDWPWFLAKPESPRGDVPHQDPKRT